MAENEAVSIYFMWPTADGEGWVVATKFEGDLKTVLKKVKAAGLPKPIRAGGTPHGWGGISDKRGDRRERVASGFVHFKPCGSWV